jgi:hypothetical protein
MKKSFFGFALTLVMAFGIASCGKSGGGGGGGGIGTSLLTSGLPQSSVDVVNSFNNWYAGANEGQNLQTGRYEITTTSSVSNSSNCPRKEIKVFGVVIGHYYACTSGGTTGGNGVASEIRIVQGQAKSTNATLASIAASADGTLVDAQFNGAAYSLVFRRADNSTVVRIIDIQYHSAFQPVQTIETSTGATSSVTDWKYLGL